MPSPKPLFRAFSGRVSRYGIPLEKLDSIAFVFSGTPYYKGVATFDEDVVNHKHGCCEEEYQGYSNHKNDGINRSILETDSPKS